MTHLQSNPRLANLLLVCATIASPVAAQGQEAAQTILDRLGRRFNPQSGRLDLYETKVTDDDLQAIAGLDGLRVLNLNVTSITDKGLAHLQGTRSLEILYLAGTRVTDQGLQHLRGLSLRDLV